MAEEAAVENLAISRFFCHKCNLEIGRVQPDYTCPTCQSGFIEALENQPEPSEESDSDMEVVQPFDLLNDMLIGLSGGSGAYRRGNRGHRNRGERRRGGRGRQVVPFENLIQDFIVNLTEVGLGGLGVTPRPNGPVNFQDFLSPILTNLAPEAVVQAVFTSVDPGLFLGNPGDYAWGREGLDTIVTQLLNQMDGHGPPPLAREKIQEIPTAVITQDQVDSNLQCSVCWEDFKVSEPVRKLVCEHVYHEPCIIPWLELHGTCPICRMTLGEEGRSDENGSSVFESQNVGPGLAALLRAAEQVDSASRASSTSSSDTSISGNSFNSNNMDIDYD
ncbi:E3 ubiquitin-protein ligase Iruka-like isoform X1 [Macrosteles quadrilineatus]|uniref:E3 ubiquitin-protein ligase Iruka-like isoform X1 n=1 Tax=Macrosteles quadrilineatus TaxID=74068 RepID=UPI0023E1A6A0|nr:E3 ubiquitin-protein ligase Iruka-like isoform X1 [Macrosteles quadrilineatus]XP_054288511.1 E3 ubiquitin-protein ligase Iruka-like isoform X1 [Macrosteles quadrilineatus]